MHQRPAAQPAVVTHDVCVCVCAYQVVDASSGSVVGAFPVFAEGHGTATCMTFSPDGRVLATSSTKGELLLWDMNDLPKPGVRGVLGPVWMAQLCDPVPCVCVCVCVAATQTIRKGKEKPLLPLCELMDSSAAAVAERMVTSMSFSPDGKWLLCLAQRGSAMKLWDVVAAVKHFARGSTASRSAATDDVLRSVTGHTSLVLSACWSPDARFMLSGGRDGTLRCVRARCVWVPERARATL